MRKISQKMLNILERLSEMFPKQNYQSRLEQYIESKRPTNAADVEHYTREYQFRESTFHWGRGL